MACKIFENLTIIMSLCDSSRTALLLTTLSEKESVIRRQTWSINLLIDKTSSSSEEWCWPPSKEQWQRNWETEQKELFSARVQKENAQSQLSYPLKNSWCLVLCYTSKTILLYSPYSTSLLGNFLLRNLKSFSFLGLQKTRISFWS